MIVTFKILLFVLQNYGFVPQTYVLPYDFKLLKRAWDDGNGKQKWILKPVLIAIHNFVFTFKFLNLIY